jgi:rare lipoprotein A
MLMSRRIMRVLTKNGLPFFGALLFVLLVVSVSGGAVSARNPSPYLPLISDICDHPIQKRSRQTAAQQQRAEQCQLMLAAALNILPVLNSDMQMLSILPIDQWVPPKTFDASHFAQTGVASWYGPGFQNLKTANGERYNMYALTAAHRTLPLSSYVCVTNITNGKSIMVRINDRGPYHGRRVIDLSYAAAKRLNMQHIGIGRVKIQGLSPQQAAQVLQPRLMPPLFPMANEVPTAFKMITSPLSALKYVHTVPCGTASSI